MYQLIRNNIYTTIMLVCIYGCLLKLIFVLAE